MVIRRVRRAERCVRGGPCRNEGRVGRSRIGVLTEIDMQQTLKVKVDREAYQ